MISWSELEKQFNELSPYFKYSRLDIQWGDSGEHFRIAGDVNRLTAERFEILATKAGKKLDRALFDQEYSEVFDEANPLKRWYKALWMIGNNLKFGFYGNTLNEQKEVTGTIFTGTIDHVTEASAVMCLRLSSMEDVEGVITPRSRSPLTIDTLHPRIIKTSRNLYLAGHYRSAVLDTYIDLVNRVKQLSGVSEIDGSKLMQYAFSINNPLIKISDDKDEQLGFMWLFSGAVMAIRNPKAHKIIDVTDPQRALEWLGFASVLHRVLDDCEKNKN